MCQKKERRTKKKSIIGYRVYRQTSTELIGFFSYFPIEKFTRTKKIDAPFHILRNEAEVVSFLDTCQKQVYSFTTNYLKIFKVRLDTNIKLGVWGDNKITKTATGDYLTILSDKTSQFRDTLIRLKAKGYEHER